MKGEREVVPQKRTQNKDREGDPESWGKKGGKRLDDARKITEGLRGTNKQEVDRHARRIHSRTLEVRHG